MVGPEARRARAREDLLGLAMRSLDGPARVTLHDSGERHSDVTAVIEDESNVLRSVAVLALDPGGITSRPVHERADVVYLHREQAELVRAAIDRVFPPAPPPAATPAMGACPCPECAIAKEATRSMVEAALQRMPADPAVARTSLVTYTKALRGAAMILDAAAGYLASGRPVDEVRQLVRAALKATGFAGGEGAHG